MLRFPYARDQVKGRVFRRWARGTFDVVPTGLLQAVQAELVKVGQKPLTPRQVQVFQAVLHFTRGEAGVIVSQAQLAGYCFCDRSTVSRAIHRLEAVGLVEVDSYRSNRNRLRECYFYVLGSSAAMIERVKRAFARMAKYLILSDVQDDADSIRGSGGTEAAEARRTAWVEGKRAHARRRRLEEAALLELGAQRVRGLESFAGVFDAERERQRRDDEIQAGDRWGCGRIERSEAWGAGELPPPTPAWLFGR